MRSPTNCVNAPETFRVATPTNHGAWTLANAPCRERWRRLAVRHAPRTRRRPMKKPKADSAQVHALLYQALETELGGVKVYESALRCAVNEDLKKEWSEYLEQTRHHVQVLLDVFARFDLDPEKQTPGRRVVAHIGASLVEAMEMARAAGDEIAAELV